MLFMVLNSFSFIAHATSVKTTGYGLPDDAVELYIFDVATGTSTILPLTQIYLAEGMGYRAKDGLVYASPYNASQYDLYTIDPVNGTETLIKAGAFADSNEPQAMEFYTNPVTLQDRMLVVVKDPTDPYNRAIYVVDPDSGDIVPDGFGGGVTKISPLDNKIAGIAIDPNTGLVYVQTQGTTSPGDVSKIYTINLDGTDAIADGSMTLVVTTTDAVDAEGLSFGVDGLLYTEGDEGRPGPAGGKGGVYSINLTTGALTLASTFPASKTGDLEGIAFNAADDLFIDSGDAPASYGDANHRIPVSITVYLGSTQPDNNTSVLSSANADGDDTDNIDDEDGITPPALAWTTGSSENISVAIQGSGYLNAWIDWNFDGDFTDAGEQISNEMAVSTGTATITVPVPLSASSGDLPSRFRLCSAAGDCNTPTGLADDGEVEDYLISVASCTSLSGDISEIAAGIPFQVASGDKVFVASNSPLPNSAGHLKAYSVQTNGSIGSAVAWDAATLMDTTKRQNKLYSTDATGTKTLFNSLDAVAFIAGASPTVAKIKEYTLTPSIDSGAFLAGRANGSLLGAMSRGNDVALLTQMNNMGQFLADTAYRTFYNGTVSSRSEKILVSSDDGFLYAFDQSTGELSWGWMPRTLAAELKDYTSFQSQGFMRGTVDIIDVKDSLGNYATYVIGSYKDGLGQYALKLNSSGGLDSVVWDQDYSAGYTAAPNHGEKDYFRDGSDLTYVTYVVTTSANQSTLVLREITTAATNTEVAVNFNATSTPYVMQIFGDSNGPAAKTLYLGDDSGNIKRTALLTAGTLDTAANLKTALEGGAVGQLNAAEPILFLGASNSISGGLYFMRAQSESRLTLLSYNSGTTNWDKRWTSYVGGAGSWDTSNTYTADNSGPPTDDDSDGFFTNVTANGIQSLPADARITDAAQIVSNVVIVPVSVQAAGSCYGRAYFYVYNLTDGAFPDNKLLNPDSTKITGDIALGFGDPSRVNVSDMPSNELMIGHGITDQNRSNDVEIDTSFLINDKLSTGIRGWKERRQE
jgi:hypothetical protein